MMCNQVSNRHIQQAQGCLEIQPVTYSEETG